MTSYSRIKIVALMCRKNECVIVDGDLEMFLR